MSTERRARGRRFLVESATIVFGVLVALGMDAAWTAHEDRSRVATHMEQAARDLAVSEAQIAASIQGESLGFEAAERLTTSQPNDVTQHPDTASVLFLRSLRIQPYRPVMGTIDALVESGDIRLVDDVALRSAWIQYRNTVGRAGVVHQSTAERSVRVLERLGTSIDLPRLLAPAGQGGASTFDFQRLSTDLALRSDLYLLGSAARNRRTVLEATLEDLEELSDALARVLEG